MLAFVIFDKINKSSLHFLDPFQINNNQGQIETNNFDREMMIIQYIMISLLFSITIQIKIYFYLNKKLKIQKKNEDF